ncbi:hypothetical protein FSP39_008510 [Pinctada imbricata]|uniref:Sushi domain-containing protein 2 n=1 Tax=Pinctada imbricata TaxID=66713 RepID=A0AA88XLI8_PINIB|nr:hypothetical protein FSP39_008510 [Pinctada imbricata]
MFLIHFQVNNNGILTFHDRLNEYKPRAFPLGENIALIAPFWADVDTERVGGKVWYSNPGETVNSSLLSRASQEIQTYFIQQRKFQSTWVFVATWEDVGYYGASGTGKDRENTFQAVLVTDESRSFVIFNYNKVEWTTGAGFNAGDQRNYYSIEGAQTDAVVNLTLTSNVGIPGKWVFQVDRDTVQNIKCSNQAEKISVYPSFRNMLGGEEISIFGPCFSSDFTILARFRETNDTFQCNYVNTTIIKCILPTVFRTGKVTLDLNPYELGWNYTSVFHLVNVASTVPILVRQEPDSWIINSHVTVVWNSSLTPSNPLRLEVLAFKSSESPDFIVISSQDFNISSFESSRLVNKTFNLTGEVDNVSVLLLKLSWNYTNENFGNAPAIWSDVFSVRWNSPQRSEAWCRAWLEEEKTQYSVNDMSGSCPCTLRQASRDTTRYVPDPFCANSISAGNSECLYYRSATRCVQKTLTSQSSSGETCCYDDNLELIDIRAAPSGGGRHTRYHYSAQGDSIVPFFTYFEKDLVPYEQCCQYSSNKVMCQSFLQFRPPTTCQDYEPPTPAKGAGDPHLTTLDGKDYTFNGLGDFVLMEDTNSSVIVQVRAIQAKDVQGRYQNASVFSGVAMTVTNVSDKVEVYSGETGAEIRINGEVVTLESSTSEYNDVSIEQNQTDTLTTNYLVVFQSVGVSLSLDVSSDFINVLVMIGNDQLKGKVHGLLGNYNGIVDDDFMPRNGTTIPIGASLREIHYQFGMTWTVEQGESLFSTPYTSQDSIIYEPQFLDSTSDSSRNATFVVELCGDNIQCRFDYEVTGNERVARSTMKFIEKFKELEEDIQKVVRCPFLSEPENGNKSVSGYQPGANATFWCDPGFEVIVGTTLRNCQEDGTWTGEHPVCAERIVPPEEENNQLITAVGIGTGSGGVLFLIVLIGLLICRCRKLQKIKATTDEESPHRYDSGIEISTITSSSHIPTPIFENEDFLTRLKDAASIAYVPVNICHLHTEAGGARSSIEERMNNAMD